MNRAIIEILTPEEEEYASYLHKIEVRRRRVADLEAEFATLSGTLTRFDALYHSQVGHLFVELDRLHLSINEYEHRIWRLNTKPHVSPETIEADIAREFAHQREQVRSEDAEAKQRDNAARGVLEQPEFNAGEEGNAKQLYRDLAKRFHPDLGRTEVERRQREVMMRRVNAAFRDRDMAMLSALLSESEVSDVAFDARPIGERLVWAIREVARLDGLVAEHEGELGSLRSNPTFTLWEQDQAGERPIETIREDLSRLLSAERNRLADLVTTYRQIVEASRR